MAKNGQSCANCRFSNGTSGVINCLRHAPTVVIRKDEYDCMWPWLDADEWCGEWQETFEAEAQARREHEAFLESVHGKSASPEKSS